MRQEKTMKVIVNHFLDPRIVLTPNVGNDKSWVWVAFDFSEGELVETVCTEVCFNWATIITLVHNIVHLQTFAIRFGSAETAQEYKAKFIEHQAEMDKLLHGGDSAEGADKADEAAKAIDSLNVKSEEPKSEEPKTEEPKSDA
jgi:hypothetical protein